jgi:hypothetical protein
MTFDEVPYITIPIYKTFENFEDTLHRHVLYYVGISESEHNIIVEICGGYYMSFTTIMVYSDKTEPYYVGETRIIPLSWLKTNLPLVYDRAVQGIVEAQI